MHDALPCHWFRVAKSGDNLVIELNRTEALSFIINLVNKLSQKEDEFIIRLTGEMFAGGEIFDVPSERNAASIRERSEKRQAPIRHALDNAIANAESLLDATDSALSGDD